MPAKPSILIRPAGPADQQALSGFRLRYLSTAPEFRINDPAILLRRQGETLLALHAGGIASAM